MSSLPSLSSFSLAHLSLAQLKKANMKILFSSPCLFQGFSVLRSHQHEFHHAFFSLITCKLKCMLLERLVTFTLSLTNSFFAWWKEITSFGITRVCRRKCWVGSWFFYSSKERSLQNILVARVHSFPFEFKQDLLAKVVCQRGEWPGRWATLVLKKGQPQNVWVFEFHWDISKNLSFWTDKVMKCGLNTPSWLCIFISCLSHMQRWFPP